METILETRRQEAAARLGIAGERVEVHRLELSKMREAGLLIDLDVHGTSMFSARVTNAELGLSSDDVRTKRLRAGSKDLFPEHSKKFRSLEARARNNLGAHTFRVTAFGNWSWMPWTAYEDFREKHAAILTDLQSLKEDCLECYEETREENRAYFEQVALRAWKALLSGYAPGATVMIQTSSGAVFEAPQDKDRFVEYVVQSALGKMPLPEEIEAGVQIDYRTSILYSESELAQDAAIAAAARAEEAEAYTRTQEAYQTAWAIEEKARIEVQAFRDAELEHARRQLAEMASPLDEALDALKANIYDAVRSLLDGVRKNDGFRGMAAQRAAGLLGQWKQLNGGLLQDAELESALTRLDSEMKTYQRSESGAREIQMDTITGQLAEIAALTSATAREIARRGGSRAAALEL